MNRITVRIMGAQSLTSGSKSPALPRQDSAVELQTISREL